MSTHTTTPVPFTASSIMRQVAAQRSPSPSIDIGRTLIFQLLELGRHLIEGSMASGRLSRVCLNPYRYESFPYDFVTDDMVAAMYELTRTGETGFRFSCTSDREVMFVSW